MQLQSLMLFLHTEMKTKSQKDSTKSGKKGRSGAKSSQKSQKTEGQAQPSTNGKGNSLNTSKDTSTTKVEDSLTISNTDSSANSKDSSGKDSSAHGKDSTANGKDSTANVKDSSNEKSLSANSTDSTVQVEAMEERKTGQELASEVGEDSKQVEQHDSGNASSTGESETKAELVATIRKELEPMCGDKDEPSTREEEIEVEVSNLVGEGVSAQGEEAEKQPEATTPGTPPPLPDGDGL